MSRWRIGVTLALLAGLALTVGAAFYVGIGSLWQSVERVGLGGFGLFTLYNLLLFLPVGWAWWAVAPGVPGRPLLFPWGRLVRESAADVLPFSQVGGLVVGVRAVNHLGVSEALVIGSQIADLTTEMAAQLFYTLFGVGMLAAILSHETSAAHLLWTAVLALGIGGAGLIAFVALQSRGLDLIGAIAGRWVKDTRERTDAVKATLLAIYAQPGRITAGVLLHGLGWILSGAGAWMALGFAGAHVDLWKVLTLEALMAAVKGVAFMTPGALGFQEGAYVLFAPLFGLTAEATLTLSLLRRAKDLVIGIPVMLIWQYSEVATRRRAAPEPTT